MIEKLVIFVVASVLLCVLSRRRRQPKERNTHDHQQRFDVSP